MNRRPIPTVRLRTLWAGLALVVVACGGSDGGTATAPPSSAPPPAPAAATPLPSTLTVTVDPHIVVGRTATIASSAGAGTTGLRYAWDFGNGTTASTAQPAAPAYAQPGRYQVRLTVTNEQGATISAAAQLLVGQLATPADDAGCTAADRGGWCQQTADVRQFQFRADGTVWGAEALGTVLKSTDGGLRWKGLPTGLSTLTQVAFADDLNGWALGIDPSVGPGWRIQRTTDGGGRWTAQALDSSSDLSNPSLIAISAERAIVHGAQGSRVTLDGGATWRRMAYPNVRLTPSGRGWIIAGGRLLQSEDLGLTIAREVPLDGTIDAVHFADDRQGWAHATLAGTGTARRHLVYRTSDGGITWTAAATAGLPDTGAIPYSSATLTAFADGTGWLRLARNIVGNPEYQFDYRSTDGGASWKRVARPVDPASPTGDPTVAMTPLSSQVAWFDGGAGRIYLTRNGGFDWQVVGPTNVTLKASQVLMPTPDTLLLQFGKRWYRSTNGGNAWSALFKEPIPSADYSNTEIGRVAHFFDASRWWVSTGLFISETTDAGANWTLRLDPKSVNVLPSSRNRPGRLQFITPARAYYLVIDASHFTSDAGSTWTAGGFPQGRPFFESRPYADADFRDERRGVYVSNETLLLVTPPPPPAAGYAYVTSDATTNWKTIALPVSPRSVRWVNDTTVVVVGVDGGIARSADGGATWTAVTSGTTSTLNRLTFNGSVVWAVGDAGTVLRSDDAGLTWKSVAVQATARLNEARFFDAGNGYIVGDRGTVLATTDGGARWTLQPTGTTQDLSAVDSTAPGIATLITTQGYILSTVTGGY